MSSALETVQVLTVLHPKSKPDKFTPANCTLPELDAVELAAADADVVDAIDETAEVALAADVVLAVDDAAEVATAVQDDTAAVDIDAKVIAEVAVGCGLP